MRALDGEAVNRFSSFRPNTTSTQSSPQLKTSTLSPQNPNPPQNRLRNVPGLITLRVRNIFRQGRLKTFLEGYKGKDKTYSAVESFLNTNVEDGKEVLELIHNFLNNTDNMLEEWLQNSNLKAEIVEAIREKLEEIKMNFQDVSTDPTVIRLKGTDAKKRNKKSRRKDGSLSSSTSQVMDETFYDQWENDPVLNEMISNIQEQMKDGNKKISKEELEELTQVKKRQRGSKKVKKDE